MSVICLRKLATPPPKIMAFHSSLVSAMISVRVSGSEDTESEYSRSHSKFASCSLSAGEVTDGFYGGIDHAAQCTAGASAGGPHHVGDGTRRGRWWPDRRPPDRLRTAWSELRWPRARHQHRRTDGA